MRVLFLGNGTWPHTWVRERCIAMVSDPLTDAPGEYELGLSWGYRHRVPVSVLAELPIVNVHTGYLPWNRGAYPNVWPLLDGSPAGVTLHWMDAGFDTGDIIAQEKAPVFPWDTAESLHGRLATQAFDLCRRTWPSIMDGTAPRTPQTGPGTEHRKRDLEAVTLRLGQTMPVERVLAILRARTFAGYPGVRFTDSGQTWDVTVNCRKVEP